MTTGRSGTHRLDGTPARRTGPAPSPTPPVRADVPASRALLGTMQMDCDTCPVRATHCDTCMVPWLLGTSFDEALDDVERRAVHAFVAAGLVSAEHAASLRAAPVEDEWLAIVG